MHVHQFWWAWLLQFWRILLLSKTAKFPFLTIDYSPSLIPPSFGVSRQLVRGVPPHGCLPSPFGSMALLFIRVISVTLFASDTDGFHPTYLPTVSVSMVYPSNMLSIVSVVAFPLSVTMSSETSLLISSLRCVTMSWVEPPLLPLNGESFHHRTAIT